MNDPFKDFLEQADSLKNIQPDVEETSKQFIILGLMAIFKIPPAFIKFMSLMFENGCPADAFLKAAEGMNEEESNHE